MGRIAAIFLGHSHLASIVTHLANREAEVGFSDPAIEYYVFDTIRLGVDFQFAVQGDDGGFLLNPRIREMVEQRVPDRELVWVSMFGGNAHNALTLLQHPRPFDIVLPENTALPRIPGAELVPTDYFRNFLLQLMQPYLLQKICLRRAVTEDVIHIESPPPNGSDDYVLAHLEPYFKEQAREMRIAPRILRYKLWRLHSEMVRTSCEGNNIAFLPAPSETMDAEGFMVPEAYSNDSTHAGPWYGGRVLKQLERRYGLPYGGWNWLY